MFEGLLGLRIPGVDPHDGVQYYNQIETAPVGNIGNNQLLDVQGELLLVVVGQQTRFSGARQGGLRTLDVQRTVVIKYVAQSFARDDDERVDPFVFNITYAEAGYHAQVSSRPGTLAAFKDRQVPSHVPNTQLIEGVVVEVCQSYRLLEHAALEPEDMVLNKRYCPYHLDCMLSESLAITENSVILILYKVVHS